MRTCPPPGAAEGSVPGGTEAPTRRPHRSLPATGHGQTGADVVNTSGRIARLSSVSARCPGGGFSYAAWRVHHGTGATVNGRRRAASRPAGMTLWTLLLVAVVVL